MNYEAAPHTADTSLSIEEVEALIADECRALQKDKRKIIHVVKRMGVTIRTYRSQLRSLDGTIQMMRLQQERAGQATTLHPRDAVRYLAPEVLSELVEGHLRERIGAVQRALGDAQKATQQANHELSRVRFATSTIMEDSSIPPELKARLKYLMAQLPEGAPGTSTATGPTSPESAQKEPDNSLEDLFE